MKAHILSYYGDIELTPINNGTRITWTELTLYEKERLSGIMKVLPENILENDFIEVDTSFEKVHALMIKGLKKRPLSASRLITRDNEAKIELVYDFKNIGDKGIIVTTEKPVPKDCPMPIPDLKKEVRGKEILKLFLSNNEWIDFDRLGMINVIGSHTGHRYLICSRWSPYIKRYGRVYDMTTERCICSKPDFTIPPSEELLSLKLAITLIENEFLNI